MKGCRSNHLHQPEPLYYILAFPNAEATCLSSLFTGNILSPAGELLGPVKKHVLLQGKERKVQVDEGKVRVKEGKPLGANCGHLGPAAPRAGAALRVTPVAAPRELRCGECARGSARGGWCPPPPSASETLWGCGGEQEAAGRSRGHPAFPFPQAGGGTGKTRLC